MNDDSFFKILKISDVGKLTSAPRHNRRAIQKEMGARGHIDPDRTRLNETLHGAATPEQVTAQIKALLPPVAKGRARRKNLVLLLELLFSLPVGSTIDLTRYFRDCLGWAAKHFGGLENIVSADIHRDEAAPHCHILTMPLRDGRLQAYLMVGNRENLQRLQVDFFESVASRYGLTRTSRLSGVQRVEGARAVLAELNARSDPALNSIVWPQFRAMIESDPRKFMTALSLEPQAPLKAARTFVEIMTSVGKGAAHETPSRALQAKPTGKPAPGGRATAPNSSIAIEIEPASEQSSPANRAKTSIAIEKGQRSKGRSLSCVEIAREPTVFSAAEQPKVSPLKPSTIEIDRADKKTIFRESEFPTQLDSFREPQTDVFRESEQPAAFWNEITGEFMQSPQTA